MRLFNLIFAIIIFAVGMAVWLYPYYLFSQVWREWFVAFLWILGGWIPAIFIVMVLLQVVFSEEGK